jgi:hypothetical protein
VNEIVKKRRVVTDADLENKDLEYLDAMFKEEYKRFNDEYLIKEKARVHSM